MNVNVHKILIVALAVFYLSWETSAAPIEGDTSEASTYEESSAASTDEETSAASIDEGTSCTSIEGISEIDIQVNFGNSKSFRCQSIFQMR